MKPHNRDEFKFSLVVTAVLLVIEIVFVEALINAFQMGGLSALFGVPVLSVFIFALTYPLRMAAYSVVALWRE